MDELERIGETLRRQRQDLEALIDSTLARQDQTAELLAKIEDLRRRTEDTQRRFDAARGAPAAVPDEPPARRS